MKGKSGDRDRHESCCLILYTPTPAAHSSLLAGLKRRQIGLRYRRLPVMSCHEAPPSLVFHTAPTASFPHETWEIQSVFGSRGSASKPTICVSPLKWVSSVQVRPWSALFHRSWSGQYTASVYVLSLLEGQLALDALVPP